MKSLLTVLLDKVERIEANMATKADIARLEDEQRQMKDEQRQMKEMLSVVRLKEIGRLDGRIDQLAQDVALGRNPTAA
ncbi:MAG TPA: hypothetical protein VD860_15495 [Azospirillum sp.]|nr:hypothetical protein [Azospirillum sp.]